MAENKSTITTVETQVLVPTFYDKNNNIMPPRAVQQAPRWDVLEPKILTLEVNPDGSATVGSNGKAGKCSVVAAASGIPGGAAMTCQWDFTVVEWEPTRIGLEARAPAVDPTKVPKPVKA